MPTFQLNFSHICRPCRHHLPLPHFTSVSVSLTVVDGHRISGKQNQLAHFLVHFQINQDEVCFCVEAVQGEHPDTTSE